MGDISSAQLFSSKNQIIFAFLILENDPAFYFSKIHSNLSYLL